MKQLSLVLLLALLLGACSYNQTIGNQKNYQITNRVSEMSSVTQEIPVDVISESSGSTTQDTDSEADVNPDAISTVTRGAGSLLVP